MPACLVPATAHWRTALLEALLRRLLALEAPELPRAVVLPASRQLVSPFTSSSLPSYYAEPRAEASPLLRKRKWASLSGAMPSKLRGFPLRCLVEIRLKNGPR